MSFFNDKYRAMSIAVPNVHIVLGSGFGSALKELESRNALENYTFKGEIPFKDVPGFTQTTVEGHLGVYRYYENKKTKQSVTFQVGRLHGYEGYSPTKVVQTVMQPFFAGTKNFVLTNAAGALSKNYSVGSVMVIEDHINMTGTNPLVGPNPKNENGKPIGPRFLDMMYAYDLEYTKLLKASLKDQKLELHQGVYLGLLGPVFETPAEIKLYARWGIDAVGMSTVWEAISLRHAGAKLCGLSLISNLGCGLEDKPIDHEDVLHQAQKSAPMIVKGLFDFSEKI